MYPPNLKRIWKIRCHYSNFLDELIWNYPMYSIFSLFSPTGEGLSLGHLWELNFELLLLLLSVKYCFLYVQEVKLNSHAYKQIPQHYVTLRFLSKLYSSWSQVFVAVFTWNFWHKTWNIKISHSHHPFHPWLWPFKFVRDNLNWIAVYIRTIVC